MNEIPKTAEDIKNTQSADFNWINLNKKAESTNKSKTINICPTSMPMLNDSKGHIIESSFPNIDLSKYENPKPCIKPKNAANE